MAPAGVPRDALCGWLVLATILLVEWGLFRQYALREVVWAYPPHHDQLGYLSKGYDTYQQILDRGLWQGLLEGARLTPPQGFLIHLEAAVLFLLLGASRLSALTLNFAHFALLQVALVGTLRSLTRGWAVPALGLGLLLIARTPFYWAGGLMDFRLDFGALCLFGVFICTVLRSGVFASPGWSVAAGAVAAWCVLFRYITLAYILGIFAVLAVGFGLQAWRIQPGTDGRRRATRRLGGVAGATAVLAAVTALPLWSSRSVLLGYYWVGHVAGAEKAIRAREAGVHTLGDALAFYVRSLGEHHAGPLFLLAAGLSLAVTLLLAWLARRRPAAAAPPALPWGVAYGFLAACLLVPYLILTADASKSPVVANVMVPPLLLLVLAPTAALARTRGAGGGLPVAPIGLALLGAVALIGGTVTQLEAFGRRGEFSPRRTDVNQVLELHDTMARYSLELGWSAPTISVDTVSDHLNHLALKVLAYERHEWLLQPRIALASSIFAPTEEEAVALLEGSDFAMMTVSPNSPEPRYPFSDAMRSLRPKLLALCDRTFVVLRRYRIFGRNVVLYVRPSLRLDNVGHGGISGEGVTLVAHGAVLRARPRIELRGQRLLERLESRPVRVRAELLDPAGRPRAIRAAFAAAGPTYVLTAEVDPAAVDPETFTKIRVALDVPLGPKEIGRGDDGRPLMIGAPDRIDLLPAQPHRSVAPPSRPTPVALPRSSIGEHGR